VFPCRERDDSYVNGKGETVKLKAKAPYTGNGKDNATTDEATIRGWWKRWPNAMIALAMGADGLFVIDFDPRMDNDTGEVWTLERLKGELEELVGGEIPSSLAVVTPSSGVHVYLQQPKDDRPRLKNRVGTKKSKHLPQHVDVRAAGGYVILPPSHCEGGESASEGHYRWLRGKSDTPVTIAPDALVDLLLKKNDDAPAPRPAPAGDRGDPSTPPPSRPRVAGEDPAREAIERYGWRALQGECKAIREAQSGARNAQLNESALKIASLTCSTPYPALDESAARAAIESAARSNPGRDDDSQLIATINSGWSAGLNSARDLAEIAASARDRASRRPTNGSAPRYPSGAASPRPAPGPAPVGGSKESFQTGTVEGPPMSEGGMARQRTVSQKWLERRLAKVERTPKALTGLAYAIGRRIGGDLLDEWDAKEKLWSVYELVDGIAHDDIDRAISDGIAAGFDFGPAQLMEKCVGYPMTDFGIAERFRDRFGANYRFTTAKGWLGWDERRWKELDQEKDTPPAEVITAVFETVRAIQDEARYMAETGIRFDTGDNELALDQEFPHGLNRLIPKGKTFVELSGILAHWGRQSESAGKPASIAMLARRWLTVPIESFDLDPLAVNVLNGTLRFAREELPDGKRSASVTLCAHRREDYLTKLAPVEYDGEAKAPLYDAMLEWAQPDSKMRRYVHQVGGYGCTGLTGEHKLWFNYGRGRNGKSTTIDAWCHSLGDYSGTTLIETFLDQGIKKRGDQASPDLARLGGVRMLRASEPERGAKLNAALIKFVTGGEPVPTRALHRGFFDMLPQFKLLMSGNSKPDIPDTDEGIWSRMKLISWKKNIDLEFDEHGRPKKDPELLNKIKAREAAGVFNRLVKGLLDYLENGLVEPEEVTAATQAYRDASDPLARFLRLCTQPDPASRIQSSRLHDVFVAWCKAAGEREWSNKGLAKALADKGYEKKASDGMQWLGLKLIKDVGDFVDREGNVISLPDDDDPPERRAASQWDEDDLPP